ncbi:cobalt-precorrin-6A reductase [Paracoccus sp. 11-3]|uniref:Cobalt-precorrin-6A reductase n=1 Tax=Paracoccus amoyensis TaxID=2760093 RepID=A0A926JC30_9RHOB|nr:cobalt-precorrin-6A reductase [Paracoccus amoyensis]MBC9245934.1 cobalt-precorrin-6A reductase [Paracoccus amoyensis]
MNQNLLILGGTSEAVALAKAVAEMNIATTISLAGRVMQPRPQPVPMRVGGFGGAPGLAEWLRAHAISHVIDATHPFAAQISANAVTACDQADVPLLALTRPAWTPVAGDSWTHVADIRDAATALCQPALRVMLAIGRMHLGQFAINPQHFYLLRLVDTPDAALPLPRTDVIVDRGPFSEAGDRDLLMKHDIQLVVAKNAGGDATYSKITAARSLGLRVLMIDRPAIPARPEVHDIAAALDWIVHSGTDRGV